MATDLETADVDYINSAECRESLVPFLEYLLGHHEQMGGATEILLVPPQGRAAAKTMSGLFTPAQLDALVELLRPVAREKVPRGGHPRIGEAAVTYNPHPVAPAAQSPKAGKFTRCKLSEEVDVVAYSLFSVLIEPVRPADVPATEEQRERARLVARKVANYFKQRGIFPIPIEGGSFFQLLIPTTAYEDVERALEDGAALLRLLNQRYSTPAVMVGSGDSPDALQVLPLPGTLNIDGPSESHTVGHYVRLCKPTMPDDVDVFGILAADIAPFLAGKHETAETSTAEAEEDDVVEGSEDLSAAPAISGTTHAPTRAAVAGWDAKTAGKVLAAVLERAELTFRVKKQGGDHHYQFKYCPSTPDPDGQHSHECGIVVQADGRFSVKCLHDEGATWLDFKYLIGWFDHAPQVMRELGIAPRSCPYRATDAGLFYLQRHRGHRRKVRMTNFSARILRDIEEDDGVETTHLFEVEACVDGNVSRFQLTAAQFAAMAWPAQRLGARAVTFPGGSAGHIRAAIQLLSPDVLSEKVYKHLGWRTVGSENVYLHAGGAIGKHGVLPGVQVDVPEPLTRYQLPDPPSGQALREAVQASLRVLNTAPDPVTVPLFAAVWRAAVGAADFAVHLVGGSGGGKTSLTALLQQHWGSELDAARLPGSWLSTANANELLAFCTKDAVLVVDDFVPTGHSEGARQHREADRLLRAQANSTGRGRLRSDATLRPPQPPRGLIVSTGELVPRGQSLRARLFVLQLPPGGVDWE
jgi:hypothetical protein